MMEGSFLIFAIFRKSRNYIIKQKDIKIEHRGLWIMRNSASKICESSVKGDRTVDKTFVNFTNHSSDCWEEKQKEEALKYGKITDIAFPAVNPEGDESYIEKLTETCMEKIMSLHPGAVLCQGEFCLSYRIVRRLCEKGIPVLSACSMRIVKEEGRKKEVTFEFRRFRRYEAEL